MKAAYDDFGHHQAAFGFYIGDEPSVEESDLFITAMNIVKEEMERERVNGVLSIYK